MEEKAAVIMFLQKIQSYEKGQGEGRVLDTEKIPKLREKWGQLYKWMFELMKYMDGMACWDIRALRTSSMKTVIHEAAGIRYQEGAEKLIPNKKESG